MNKKVIGFETALHLPISNGDVVVVSSDMTRLSYAEYEQTGDIPDLNLFIDNIIKLVGSEGTILVPVFNWDFCKGITFDILKTKGQTGALGNSLLHRQDFKRTLHPLYSFMVWGKYQGLLCSLKNFNSFGDNTPFDFLYKIRAKWLFVDIDFDQGFTFIHHMEQIGKVPYRYNKEFTSRYVDADGKETIKTFSMYVRDHNMDVVQYMVPIESDFLKSGIAKKYFFDDISYMIVEVAKTYKPILKDIKENKCRKIFKYKGQNE